MVSRKRDPFYRHLRSRGALVALGLLGLPVAGSVFIAGPATASAADRAPAPPVTAEVLDPVLWAAAPVFVDGAPTVVPAGDDHLSEDAALEVYIASGYTWDDAMVLSESWGVGDVFRTKVKAGDLLAAGVPLTESPFADPAAADGLTPDDLVDVFLAFGYTAADAAVLAQAWGVDVGEAKVRAGSELKTVGVLPFVDLAPTGYVGDGNDPRFDAFFAAGYEWDDAVLLAEFWGSETPVDAKLKVGDLLIAGSPIPAEPGVVPAS